MIGRGRVICFMLILMCGSALIFLFYFYKPSTRLDSTLAPAYQLFGHATKGLSRALTQVIPVDNIDEKKYGDAIVMRCDAYSDPKDKDFIYVNEIMGVIIKYSKKPFFYKVYIQKSDAPNAFALPGGVIFVTRGLLANMESESELVSVLAHEMGHIELSHCLDIVRFELLAKKIGAESLGKLADFAMNLLLRHSFSKTQEDDADTYAFELLKNSAYDPSAEGRTFEVFIKYCAKFGKADSPKANVIRDYFLSHPPLSIREEKFSEKARLWWKKHHDEKRYVGKMNLKNRNLKEYDNEWVYGGVH